MSAAIRLQVYVDAETALRIRKQARDRDWTVSRECGLLLRRGLEVPEPDSAEARRVERLQELQRAHGISAGTAARLLDD